MAEPVIFTRREFLQRAVAAGTLLTAGGGFLEACADDGPDRAATATTTPELDRIVRVAIHPSVGIARVGNSADSFYFGPELPGTLPMAPDGFKDASGAIARQAARFRVYGYDAQGAVVREVTATDATVTWEVSVANKKAAWYDFNTAMDIPVARPVTRRNDKVIGADRDRLVVASGERSIAGVAAAPVPLDAGRFLDAPVPLGELLTDEDGRLVFLPAEGRGYAPGQAALTTFSDNDGWCDDTCDGPVLATVTIGGRTLEADPGWVIVTPPNYGPGLVAGLVTGYDSSRLGWDTFDPSRLTASDVSFRDDILPIFGRIVDMQWVNAGFLGSNGWGSGADYLEPSLLDQLADPSATASELRQRTFDQFRNPDRSAQDLDAAPQIYGDGIAIPARSAYQMLTVTPIQHGLLAAWAAGTFTDDRGEPAPAGLDELNPLEQTEALDRAGLDACLGGAYHPGIEVPWTLRVPSMWSAPRRLKVRSTVVENPDYGAQLTPQRTMSADGPLAGSGPGDLTRWQGTPWQSDAASCRSGYEPSVSPVLPTFWPARIPNHVLREVDYRIVVDTSAPMADRQAAFDRRYDWERFVTAADSGDLLDNMVERWADLGIVTEQPGPTDGTFPAVMKVETHVGFATEPTVSWNAAHQESNPQVWDGEPVTGPQP
ncbi:MAG: LodA/GoxA family CTQ-dependent oxidase [Ilumatobacteraceae bacterium]